MKPSIGTYQMTPVPGDLPAPNTGTPMTSEELAQCSLSDDDRFGYACPDGYRVVHQFAFPIGSKPHLPIEIRWEGYTDMVDPSYTPLSFIRIWDNTSGQWFYYSEYDHQHFDEFDTWLFQKVRGQTWPALLDPSGLFWFAAFGVRFGGPPWGALTLYTDCIRLIEGGKVAAHENLFGQRFRAFDDGDESDISFERRDHPGLSWSTPTQPFSGDDKHSPDIECLRDGSLRAAYIDGDGALRQALSPDDGDSWEML